MSDDENLSESEKENSIRLNIHGSSNFYKTEKSGKMKSNGGLIAYNTQFGQTKNSGIDMKSK